MRVEVEVEREVGVRQVVVAIAMAVVVLGLVQVQEEVQEVVLVEAQVEGEVRATAVTLSHAASSEWSRRPSRSAVRRTERVVLLISSRQGPTAYDVSAHATAATATATASATGAVSTCHEPTKCVLSIVQ